MYNYDQLLSRLSIAEVTVMKDLSLLCQCEVPGGHWRSRGQRCWITQVCSHHVDALFLESPLVVLEMNSYCKLIMEDNL